MVAVSAKKAVLPNAILGMLIFIGTEVMFFAALISAFIALRTGETFWPPAGQPRLPIEATAFNTLVLLGSGVVMYRAGKAFAMPFLAGRAPKLLMASILLGAFFVLFQGYEWVRLIGFDLTVSSSLYGSLFYVIIGAHALHVTAALCFLISIHRKLSSAERLETEAEIFAAARIFWYFVVGIWPVLYGLVYLY